MTYRATWPGRGLPIAETNGVGLPGLVLAVVVGLALVLLATAVVPAQAHAIRHIPRSACAGFDNPIRTVRCVARWFGVDPDKAEAVTRCENRSLDPMTEGYHGGWVFHGPWQYLEGTFRSGFGHYLFVAESRWHTWVHRYRRSTIHAMRKVRHEGWGAWSCA